MDANSEINPLELVELNLGETPTAIVPQNVAMEQVGVLDDINNDIEMQISPVTQPTNVPLNPSITQISGK